MENEKLYLHSSNFFLFPFVFLLLMIMFVNALINMFYSYYDFSMYGHI